MTTASVGLTIVRGSNFDQEYLFNEPAHCVVGRSDDCDIPLLKVDDPMFVSRHHCDFEIDPPVVRVRDLGSRNGTYVNDEKIGQRPTGREADFYQFGARELKDGDEVRIGEAVLRVAVHSVE